MTAKNQVIAILFAVFLIMLYISAKARGNSTQNSIKKSYQIH